MHIITHSYCVSVSVSRKRLCVSVFDRAPTLAVMLTLVDQDTSPLLWEKADGEPAFEHSTGCLCVVLVHFVKVKAPHNRYVYSSLCFYVCELKAFCVPGVDSGENIAALKFAKILWKLIFLLLSHLLTFSTTDLRNQHILLYFPVVDFSFSRLSRNQILSSLIFHKLSS